MGTRVLVVAALVAAAAGCAPLRAERPEPSRLAVAPVQPVSPPAVAVQPTVRGTAWTLAGLYPSTDGAGNDPFPGFQIPPWLLPPPSGKQGNSPQQWQQIPIPWSAIRCRPGGDSPHRSRRRNRSRLRRRGRSRGGPSRVGPCP